MEKRIEEVLDFIRTRPLISVRELEREANIPFTTLHRALNGQRGLPVKHLDNLESVLKNYGYHK